MVNRVHSIYLYRENNQTYLTWAALSVLPVVVVAYICCQYDHAELLVGLFLVEWVVALSAWRLLCPWLGSRGVMFASVPFLLSFILSSILVQERIVVFGELWTGSDDWWYLNEASKVAQTLHSSGWDMAETWSQLTSCGAGAWTLSGWPFALGLVSSFVTNDISPEILYHISVSINAVCLTIVFALLFNLLFEALHCRPMMILAFFLLLIFDPVVYAGQCLKESFLQLCLMSTFAACFKAGAHLNLKWTIIGLLGVVGITTTRPAYIPLIAIVLCWLIIERYRLSRKAALFICLAILMLIIEVAMEFRLREATFGALLSGQLLEAENGTALLVYNIPVVGPFLFYAISPVPPLPWKLFSHKQIVATVLRSIGSLAWLFSAVFVLRGINKNRTLLSNKLFVAAAIMFSGLFIAVVLRGDDPRYKQPTNFFLAIMLCITWFSGHISTARMLVRNSRGRGA